jgi:hypothetical protein
MPVNQKLSHVIAGRSIALVRQDDAVLHLELNDGSTVQVILADPASSVMVRDKDGKLEYAD